MKTPGKYPESGLLTPTPEEEDELILREIDRLLKHLLQITKNSCDTSLLIASHQKSPESMPSDEDETMARLCMQRYSEIMEGIPAQQDFAKDRQESNLGLLKEVVENYMVWEQIVNGKTTVLKRPKMGKKVSIIFVDNNFEIPGKPGSVILAHNGQTCYIKNNNFSERWAGFALIGLLQALNLRIQWSFPFKLDEDQIVINEISMRIIELSAVNRAANNQFITAAKAVIDEYKINSFSDYMSIELDQAVWLMVRKKFDAVFSDNNPMNEREIIYRDAVYAFALLLEVADITSSSSQEMTKILKEYLKEYYKKRIELKDTSNLAQGL